MTPVVIDASAGVELVAYTVRGRALRRILPPDAVPWVPELFYVQCGAVLRRWALRAALSPAQMTAAIDELMAWPLRVTEVRGLWRDAWHLRANVTFSDALYVALAEHLAHSCSPTTRSWPPRRTCQSERCTSADLIQFQKGFASSIGPHGADRTKGVHVTITMSVVLADDCERVRGIVVGFLAGDCGGTRRSYATDLRIFATWCAEANLDLFAVRRAHLELFGRWMEEEGKMRSTVARRLSSLASFYRYCEQEGLY